MTLTSTGPIGPTPAPSRPQPDPATSRPPGIDSALLFRGARELEIRHGDDRYRLRHTRNGKLILTK